VKFLKDIKEKIGYSSLNKIIEESDRNKSIRGLNSTKSVGIVFSAADQETYDKAKKLAAWFTEKKIKVSALGYVEEKEVLSYYSYYVGFDFYCKKNLNWLRKPTGHIIENFIENPIDILIDLSLVDEFPILYVVAHSQASFKVGRLSERTNYYDLMIDIEQDNTIDFLIDQVKNYLTMINSNNQI